MKRFISWLFERFGDEQPQPPTTRRPAPVVRRRPKPSAPRAPVKRDVRFNAEVGGKIEDGGPGKNVLVRGKYQSDDGDTVEDLKILDESMLEPGEGDGIDPYNTGRFDRSKTWDSTRFRK